MKKSTKKIGRKFLKKERKMSATKKQVGGNHYKKYKIQPVEFAQANELNYCESNIIKYAVRHKDKNGIDDVKKIIHYAELLLELEYSEK